jgi:hypothetical protein
VIKSKNSRVGRVRLPGFGSLLYHLVTLTLVGCVAFTSLCFNILFYKMGAKIETIFMVPLLWGKNGTGSARDREVESLTQVLQVLVILRERIQRQERKWKKLGRRKGACIMKCK